MTRPTSSAQSVTTARPPLHDEQVIRMRKYLISMGIRTVCFVGAAIADGWLRWVLVAGAVLLPLFAVVIANAVKPRALNVAIDPPNPNPRRHVGQ